MQDPTVSCGSAKLAGVDDDQGEGMFELFPKRFSGSFQRPVGIHFLAYAFEEARGIHGIQVSLWVAFGEQDVDRGVKASRGGGAESTQTLMPPTNCAKYKEIDLFLSWGCVVGQFARWTVR